MLRRYYGKISKLPINEFFGHDGELVVDDITGKVYVMDGVTLGGTELVGATPRFGTTPPVNPTPGALWYDPESGRTYIYYQSQWVDAAPNTTYTLPHASPSTLGGIKVGLGLAIDNEGVVTANSHTPSELINGEYTLNLSSDGWVRFPEINATGAAIAPIDDGISLGTDTGNVSIWPGESQWHFNTDGNLTTPSGMTIGSSGFIGQGYGIQGVVNQRLSVSSKGIDGSSALLWGETYDEMGGLISLVNVDNSGVSFYTGNVSVGPPNIFYFDMDGNLLLPPNSTISSQADDLSLYAEGNVNITSKGHKFIFDTDTVGRFIMPPSGVIAGHGTAGNGLNIFVGNTTTEVGKTWNFSTAGNLSLPGEGNITSTSGNVHIIGNILANTVFASSGFASGFKFSNIGGTQDVTGLFHFNNVNQLILQHQGNIGVRINANGSTVIDNIKNTNLTSIDMIVANASVENLKSNFISAGTGNSKGYKFFDISEGQTSTGIIHNSDLNQIQIIHESNIGFVLNSNGSSIISNTFAFSPTGIITIPSNGRINYSNGQSILSNITGNGNTNTHTSSNPPLTPATGQLWYDTNSGKIFVYLTDAWVDTSPANSPVTDRLVNGSSEAVLAGDGALILSNIIEWADNTGLQVGSAFWHFNTNGNISLPIGGDILDSDGNSVLGAVGSSYDDNNVAAYLPTNNIIIGLIANANVQAHSINTILSNLAVQTGNSVVQQNTINYLLANTVSQQANISSLRANITGANAAIVTANVGMKSYVDTTVNNYSGYWIANAEVQIARINDIYSNLSAQLSNSTIQQNTIDYLLANTVSQQANISSLRANITGANAAIVTANVGMKSYVDTTVNNYSGYWIANAEVQIARINDIYSNLSAQLSNSTIQQNTIDYLLANTVSQQANISSLRANITGANAAIVTANVGMKLYVDNVTASWIANAEVQIARINDIYSNISVQIGNSTAQQNTIDYLLANTVAQENSISSLRANVVAANSVISTKTVYSNSNVAAYMPTYSGSIGGTITVGAILQAPQYTKASNATGTVGQICWDSNYIYVCTATNTWKRVALTGGY